MAFTHPGRNCEWLKYFMQYESTADWVPLLDSGFNFQCHPHCKQSRVAYTLRDLNVSWFVSLSSLQLFAMPKDTKKQTIEG